MRIMLRTLVLGWQLFMIGFLVYQWTTYGAPRHPVDAISCILCHVLTVAFSLFVVWTWRQTRQEEW